MNGKKHLANFRSILSSRELDAILLANYRAVDRSHYNYNLYYVTDLLGHFPWCFLLITEDDCRLWVDVRDVGRARSHSWVHHIESIKPRRLRYSTEEFAMIISNKTRDMLRKTTGNRNNVRIGVDGNYMPSSIVISLATNGLQIKDITLDLEKSRLIKDERELQLLRRAAIIADSGVEKIMEEIHLGATELELSILAECEMRENGAECFWWPSMIASGPEVELWANSPTERNIRSGDLLWMDFTPVYAGYAVDIARSFVFGEAGREHLEVFNLAEKTLVETASKLRDGVAIKEVIDTAAGIVSGSPYEKYYKGPGHMIGLHNSVYPVFCTSVSNVKKMPASISNMTLLQGMTVAIEIIFNVPALGGIHLEDNYIVTSGPPERMTNAPLKRSVSPL